MELGVLRLAPSKLAIAYAVSILLIHLRLHRVYNALPINFLFV